MPKGTSNAQKGTSNAQKGTSNAQTSGKRKFLRGLILFRSASCHALKGGCPLGGGRNIPYKCQILSVNVTRCIAMFKRIRHIESSKGQTSLTRST
jgi:hypothetical protein